MRKPVIVFHQSAPPAEQPATSEPVETEAQRDARLTAEALAAPRRTHREWPVYPGTD